MKWPMVPLSKVAIINPRRPRDIKLRGDDPVTFVPMPAVSEVTASIETPEIRPFGEVKKGFTYFEEGDVLFAKITPCMENGKSAIATDLCNGVGFGSTEFHVLRAKDNLLIPTFLHYFIRQQSFRNAAKSKMRGAAGQQRVPKDFLDEVLIPLPPLSEQHHIVEILDQADALRKKRAEADAKADRILPALFYKMFGDPLALMRDRNSIPLGQFDIDLQNGFACGQKDVEDGVPHLRMNNIDDAGVLNLDLIRTVPQEKDDRRYRLQGGDVLFMGTNSEDKIGKTCVFFPPDGRHYLFSNHLIRIRISDSRLSPEFLATYLHLLWVKRFYPSIAKRWVNQATVAQAALAKVRVPVPHKQSLKDFNQAFSELLLSRDKRIQSAERVNDLFDVLLHRAFTGDLTAQWREAHMKELLEEMEQQAKALENRIP